MAVSGQVRPKPAQRWAASPICRVSDTHGENVRPTALTTSECTGLNVASVSKGIRPFSMACPWISKTGCYETPHAVTGGKVFRDRAQAQREHLKVSHDRIVGTWKAGNV